MPNNVPIVLFSDNQGSSTWFYPEGVHIDADGTITLELHGVMCWQGDADDLEAYGALVAGFASEAQRLDALAQHAVARFVGGARDAGERLARLVALRDRATVEIAASGG